MKAFPPTYERDLPKDPQEHNQPIEVVNLDGPRGQWDYGFHRRHEGRLLRKFIVLARVEPAKRGQWCVLRYFAPQGVKLDKPMRHYVPELEEAREGARRLASVGLRVMREAE